MDTYLCLGCGNIWQARVEKYRDWTRRQCPKCRKRTTVKKELFDRAVAEYTRSLEQSPPPHRPQGSAVAAVFKLLRDTFPGSFPVKVFWHVDRAAREAVKARKKTADVEARTAETKCENILSLAKLFSTILPEVNFEKDENYLAVAFALVLDWLLCREPHIALDILAKLGIHDNELVANNGQGICVSARSVFEHGQPDLKFLSRNNLLVYIGVTLDSRLVVDQIARYREALNSSCADMKGIVLLTGPKFMDDKNIPPDIRNARLSDVQNWLVDARAKVKDPAVGRLLEEFMSVLEEKGVA